MKKFLATDPSDLGSFILRATLGVVLLVSSIQKAFVWFGGGETVQFFANNFAVPGFPAAFLIVAEALFALALIFGFLTRFCALAIIIIMLSTIEIVHWKSGIVLFERGFEYPLLLMGSSLVLFMKGAGAHALDSRLAKKMR